MPFTMPLRGQTVPVGAQPQKALGKSAPLLQHRRKASAPRPLTPVAASTQEGSNPSTEAPQRRGPVGSLIDMSQPGLSRRQVLQAAGAAATAVACPCCPTGPAMAAADWDYESAGFTAGYTGWLRRWSGICAAGGQQSPVDLPLALYTTPDEAPKGYTNKFGDIKFKYGVNETVDVLNTGHGTMQVNFKPGNTAVVGGSELELVQYHFHTPSEHTFDGVHTPLEVHLVHRVMGTASLAVVGVLLERGAKEPNPAVQLALDAAPRQSNVKVQAPRSLSPMALLPEPKNDHRPYFHYIGSLTTPPCSEGIDWFVMSQTVKITDKQVLDFMQFVGKGASYNFNARPPQPPNNRELEFEL
uniref:carbonic anhydrase n=1 Tax=Dunaliella tertiolecta TaxID=3047 RepID=A0A7S3VU25_DUNTE|mmetsp:Transcript_19214/g.53793  ORF Transcript_19214/g.53793 Transcript_19214/m.53793 type:complete len:356 (-) Transcript_19214:562-1629(-)